MTSVALSNTQRLCFCLSRVISKVLLKKSAGLARKEDNFLNMLWKSGSLPGSSSHSMKYFYSSMLDPSQGLPQFVGLGYVDSQVVVYYDSNIKKAQSRVSWMEKVGKEHPQYWDRDPESRHQSFASCAPAPWRVSPPASQGPSWPFRAAELDPESSQSSPWWRKEEGAQPGGGKPRRLGAPSKSVQWELSCLLGFSSTFQALEGLGVNSGGAVSAQIPVVTVSNRTEADKGMETHVCCMDGFYPKEIDVSWRRDGAVWLQDTLCGSVAPNADGTFHYWLSIQIDPKERSRYWCHVEYGSLQEPVDVAMEEPGERLGRDRAV
ncbi:patr class I histocompatibility antigen, B-1 alpha chain-like [Candoia aspera]|uniref:patr class I histocompatibility antigen, B-1 alpha chain-like n=1 Tax=Candoia aspera TaxID=51853 RepID=UPI002FD7C689